MPGRRAVLASCCAILAAPRLHAQPAWPSDRVTIVASLPAGSSVDITSRIIGEKLAQRWGKPVLIDNRGGGNGVLACEMVARARPDGHTLLGTSAMTHAANPALYERLPYDPVRDFAALARLGLMPFVVMAHKGLATPTLEALIAKLRAEPARHHFGAGSVPSRIATEKLRQLAGLDVAHVGYRGNQQGFPDLIEGRIAFMTVDVVGAKPLVDRGAIDALALSAPARHPALPNVPTAAEAGLPGFEFVTWSGFYAPKATPPAIVARIADDIAWAMQQPDTSARLDQLGSSREPPLLATEFDAFTASEIESWGRVIRQAGLKLE